MSNGHTSIEKKHPEDANCNGEAQSEDFWKVLLSEPHASFQAIQRAIAEIQSKILSLVQQHNPSTDAHLSSDMATETPERLEKHEGTSGEKRYGDQIHLEWKSVFWGISVKMTLFVFLYSESFAVLTARVAEYHKELAAVPEMIKVSFLKHIIV